MNDIEKFYRMKALLEYQRNDASAKNNTLIASLIAWFALYLTEAIKDGGSVYAIFAFMGIVILTCVSIFYYLKGQEITIKLSRMNAAIHILRQDNAQ
ncbi:hypothetical protein [Vibrio hepatarius]|uniref:hypothetical protein n=1 Tax=Vibrio hepatarius TaxID=171383 RepID=UPI001C0A46C2|nr:hypothetical protein [Vibrio hepatarius]MBU2895295.1 hypothetical protein [Vibrio hepatarius]